MVMKCKICGGSASIKLESHNLKICEKDFLKFFERRVESTIKEYKMFTPKERILVAVSGGVDSLILWEVLLRLGYQVVGYHLNLNIPNASEPALEKVQAFAKDRNRELIIENLSEILVASLEQASKIMRKPTCSVCGMLKRYRFNRIACEKKFDVVTTGHHLDDESATLLGNILHWQEGYLARQFPVLTEREGMARKVKPLVFVSKEEIEIYAKVREIDFIRSACPYSKGATSIIYKQIINQLEKEMPSTKIFFLKTFFKKYQSRFKEDKILSNQLKPCSQCGYLTIAELCGFCSLKNKLKEKGI